MNAHSEIVSFADETLEEYGSLGVEEYHTEEVWLRGSYFQQKPLAEKCATDTLVSTFEMQKLKYIEQNSISFIPKKNKLRKHLSNIFTILSNEEWNALVVAYGLVELGQMYEKKNKLSTAIQSYTVASCIFSAELGDGVTESINIYSIISRLQLKLGDFESALSSSMRVYRIKRGFFGTRSVETADAMIDVYDENFEFHAIVHDSIGTLFHFIGDNNKALVALGESYRLSLVKGCNIDTASTVLKIAMCFSETGDMKTACLSMIKAIEIIRSINGGSDLMLVEPLNYLAVLYMNLDNMDKALDTYQYSFLVCKANTTSNFCPTTMAKIKFKMSQLYQIKNENEKALTSLKEALVLMKKKAESSFMKKSRRSTTQNESRVYLLSQMGRAFFILDDTKNALASFKVSIKLSLCTKNNEQNLCKTFHFIGLLYWKENDLSQASNYLSQAINLYESIASDKPYLLSLALMHRGGVMEKQHYLDEAQLLYKSALQIIMQQSSKIIAYKNLVDKLKCLLQESGGLDTEITELLSSNESGDSEYTDAPLVASSLSFPYLASFVLPKSCSSLH